MSPLEPGSYNLKDHLRGQRNLDHILAHLGEADFDGLMPILGPLLASQADPDMALNNLERFWSEAHHRKHLAPLLEHLARGLETLLQLFSTSQFFADLIISDPACIALMQTPPRLIPELSELIDDLNASVAAASDDAGVLRAFRQFRQRQLLRVGINDIVRERSLEEITRDLSAVAQASIEVSLAVALKNMHARFGEPRTLAGRAVRCVVLGFGKLGGGELNYSSDIDLMVIFDEDGETVGKRTSIDNGEFFGRVVAELIRLLSVRTDRGQAFRVDMRLRPEGNTGPLARSLSSTLSYYDTIGRTWERQALIKVRPVAGDVELGRAFMVAIEPFVYRKYLSFAEINEIKAMKRRMEAHAHREGRSGTDVKSGYGGIRDIEFAIQFLQLLNGGDLKQVRLRNTLEALQTLAACGCLTDPEYRSLVEAYRFLRKTEHRLQILFDWQTHAIPASPEEQRKLALRMGYPHAPRDQMPTLPISAAGLSPQKHSPLDEPPVAPQLDVRDLLLDPLEQFLHDYFAKTRTNRRILDHLLHLAFVDSDVQAEPETDLILDPHPELATIRAILEPHRFKNPDAAWQNLLNLAREVPFLSPRRCRHFLAAIAPLLLRAVARTSDPDQTLNTLEQVTASLGGKAVLWELFNYNPPSLQLYVEICSGYHFLSQILINNPGMIDDLLDSLVLNRSRSFDEMYTELTQLCRGVEKPDALDSILKSFQDKEFLRIGMRDLLALETIRQTTAALSDLAETILRVMVDRCRADLSRRFGFPKLCDGPRDGQPCRFAIIGLGKLGSREMNYRSDLDLLIVYEGDISDSACHGDHYYTRLTRDLIRVMNRQTPGGLYPIDMKLRPSGKSGSLAISMPEFLRYLAGPDIQVWEMQSLTQSRIVAGDAYFGSMILDRVHNAIYGRVAAATLSHEVSSMRHRLEEMATPRSLKRGPGGFMDVEFLVQAMILRYGLSKPGLRAAGTCSGIERLRELRLITPEEASTLLEGYGFLRKVEARLRMTANRATSSFPESAEELTRLSRGVGLADGEELREYVREVRHRLRAIFAARLAGLGTSGVRPEAAL